ncbi:hypothetical protein [Aureimonas sp. N4]|uniref:hypothetical protein n=1 Tax=Aureimonas sp. N4 TaxID=1638165 RepID=UPI0007822644|nr:hypothetical protein [Aureimonas sp. N4]
MMFVFIPSTAILALTDSFLVFGPPLAIQSIAYALWARSKRLDAYLVVLTLLPALSVLTWYCWDYLTPSDFNLGINEGAEWQPYQHGISLSRYLSTLAFQAPVSLFSLIYVDLKSIRFRRIFICFSIFIAAMIGIVEGQHEAEQQYKLTTQE